MARTLTKELKRPDEFVSFWTRFGAKLKEHRGKAIALVVVVVVGVGVGWGVTTYRGSKASVATEAFARIGQIASAELLPEKAADEASDQKPEEGAVPRFKTERERLEAANKEADAFVARFGADGLGRRALLGKASRLLALGMAAEAKSLYETLAAGETDVTLQAIQEEGAAAADEAAGKLDDALQAYTRLAERSRRTGAFYLDRALFAKARVLEKQGKTQEAEKALREILEKVPKTMLRAQIDERLAVLTEK